MSKPRTSTRLGTDALGPLGPLDLAHPEGTFAPTPASLTALAAIAQHAGLLAGQGLDWGSGVGALAILAARIPSVRHVIGLELSERDVEVAHQNAIANGVAARCTFLHSDSYCPRQEQGRAALDALRGRVDFLLANPPASEGDDGFSFRRRVLAEGREFLRPGAVVFLSISAQYGEARIAGLEQDAPGLRWRGALTTTEPVPFDLHRSDLLHCLELYAAEEARGGLVYAFRSLDGSSIDARTALARFRADGSRPLSRWQVHEFRVE